VCPDNCTGNGVCLNTSSCDSLDKQNKLKYGNDTGLYLLSCGNNSKVAQANNQTGACACFAGYQGLNCALIGTKKLIALAVLGAGLIALIVLLALLGAALAGGGAAAVATGAGATSDAVIVNNPLAEFKTDNYNALHAL